MTAVPEVMHAPVETGDVDLFRRPKATSGFWSWFTTIDHKKIGILYGTTALVFFVIAGAANAVNLLDVEAVILGGGLGTRFGQPLADRIAGLMAPYLFQPDKPPRVLTAALGDRGGAIGATLLVR